MLDDDPYMAPPSDAPDKLKRTAHRLFRAAESLAKLELTNHLAGLARRPFSELTDDDRALIATQLLHVDPDSRIVWVGHDQRERWAEYSVTWKGARLVEHMLTNGPTKRWSTRDLKECKHIHDQHPRPPLELSDACSDDGTAPIVMQGASSNREYALNVEWLHRRLALSLGAGNSEAA
jgi:hypothetical protein